MRRIKELEAIGERLEEARETRARLLRERSDIEARKLALRHTASLIEKVGTWGKRSLRFTLAMLVEDEKENDLAIRAVAHQLVALEANHHELKTE